MFQWLQRLPAGMYMNMSQSHISYRTDHYPTWHSFLPPPPKHPFNPSPINLGIQECTTSNLWRCSKELWDQGGGKDRGRGVLLYLSNRQKVGKYTIACNEYKPQHPWDLYIYLHLVDVCGKCIPLPYMVSCSTDSQIGNFSADSYTPWVCLESNMFAESLPPTS